MADSNADGEAKAIDVDETVSATRDENSKPFATADSTADGEDGR